MKFSTFLIGGAALVGFGIYLGKKMAESEFLEDFEEDNEFYCEEKETYGEKFHKASMYAVGAIKTGAEKIAQSIKEIKSQDMIKKGEETIDRVKEGAEQIKEDVSDIKDMAISINSTSKKNNVFSDEDDGIMETKNNPFDNDGE